MGRQRRFTNRSTSTEVALTPAQQEAVRSVLPYRGENAVLPDKVNPSIPDHVWSLLQDSADMASQHLFNLLSHPRFPNLPINEQARIIELALSRAYGAPDGGVRKNLHLHQQSKEDEAAEKHVNAMRSMARAAGRRLPEFARSQVIDVELSDKDSSN